MKVLTANRLTDGVAVWYGIGDWIETLQGADVAADKADEARLEAIGKAAFDDNQVVDVNLIDVVVGQGVLEPVRLRERIRAAGPTNRTDIGKQAEPGGVPAA